MQPIIRAKANPNPPLGHGPTIMRVGRRRWDVNDGLDANGQNALYSPRSTTHHDNALAIINFVHIEILSLAGCSLS